MWFNLIAARIPPEKIDWQPNLMLIDMEKALKSEQLFIPATAGPIIPVSLLHPRYSMPLCPPFQVGFYLLDSTIS